MAEPDQLLAELGGRDRLGGRSRVRLDGLEHVLQPCGPAFAITHRSSVEHPFANRWTPLLRSTTIGVAPQTARPAPTLIDLNLVLRPADSADSTRSRNPYPDPCTAYSNASHIEA